MGGWEVILAIYLLVSLGSLVLITLNFFSTENELRVRDIFSWIVVSICWPVAIFLLIEEHVLSHKFLDKVLWRRKK